MSLMDEVLDGLRLHSTVFSRMTLAGEWGFAKDELQGAPFHLVLSGRACCRLDGEAAAQPLEAGDIVILPHGNRHRLLAHPHVEPIPWRRVIDQMGLTQWKPGMRFKSVDLRYGEGEPVTTLISGVFAFGHRRKNPLLESLPPILLVRAGEKNSAAEAVASVTSLLDTELLSGKPGAESVAARLGDILFIQVIRHYLTASNELPPGWLRGLADRELGAAIALMHAEPNRHWSVASLAHELAMSRSRFAARFQEVVGQGPLEYLTQWRMYQAAGRLAEGKVPLSALALSSGYRSEVAFSKAFKRWAGLSPVEYRRSLEQASQPIEPPIIGAQSSGDGAAPDGEER
ncbi:MAG: AraC family transcriptional regulator [Phycisphaerales bacterium]|nr:AraC family transcriptional regulator [Hyphomonadaceae bacterium]